MPKQQEKTKKDVIAIPTKSKNFDGLYKKKSLSVLEKWYDNFTFKQSLEYLEEGSGDLYDK